MAGYACPCCGEISEIYGLGGGVKMAAGEGLEVLGKVPIDTELVKLLDAVASEGVGEDDGSHPDFPLLRRYQATPSARIWTSITENIVKQLGERRDVTLERLGASSPS
jgi:hypothetical protein